MILLASVHMTRMVDKSFWRQTKWKQIKSNQMIRLACSHTDSTTTSYEQSPAMFFNQYALFFIPSHSPTCFLSLFSCCQVLYIRNKLHLLQACSLSRYLRCHILHLRNKLYLFPACSLCTCLRCQIFEKKNKSVHFTAKDL